MSNSFKRFSSCVDSTILSGAIYTIYRLDKEKGYLGSEAIVLNCQQLEKDIDNEGVSSEIQDRS